jgi:hypothetical protein
MLQLQTQRSIQDIQQYVAKFWRSVLGRPQVKVGTLARIVTFTLGRAFTERGTESEPHAALCAILAKQLIEPISSVANIDKTKSDNLVGASSLVFAREMFASFKSTRRISVTGNTAGLEDVDLLRLAMDVSGRFWRHAAVNVTFPVSELAKMSASWDRTEETRIRAFVVDLLQGFYELHQLQHSLCDIELGWKDSRGQRLGVGVQWDSPDVDHAIDEYGKLLIQITEAAEQSTKITDIAIRLKQALDSLQNYLTPALDDIFPEASAVFDDQWNQWELITGLPRNVAKSLNNTLRRGQDRVFLPRMLLTRFFMVAMENFKTAAFQGWSEEQVREEAYAQVSIFGKEDSDGHPKLYIKISDNGKLHRQETGQLLHRQPRAGTGLGLSDIAKMVKPFGGELIGLQTIENETIVELELRSIIFGGSLTCQTKP